MKEYVELGNEINQMCGMEETVQLYETDIQMFSTMNCVASIQTQVEMGTNKNINYNNFLNKFDFAFTIHVGMNLSNKISFFKSAFNLLKNNSQFFIYDLVSIPSLYSDHLLSFPLPWSSHPSSSYLESLCDYCNYLELSGFTVVEAFHDEKNTFQLLSQALKIANEQKKFPISPLVSSGKFFFL